jgi:putative transposase
MTAGQQHEESLRRKLAGRPPHSPPHYVDTHRLLLVTATCYEHQPLIGRSETRMEWFAGELLAACATHGERLDAWVLLPNHYHLVVLTTAGGALLKELGKVHGRASFRWNGEDQTRGRKVWFNLLDRPITTDRYHRAAIQYVHHNPVKHGYAAKWSDWRWSSAMDYVAAIGREEAVRRWREIPLLNFGKGWDD